MATTNDTDAKKFNFKPFVCQIFINKLYHNMIQVLQNTYYLYDNHPCKVCGTVVCCRDKNIITCLMYNNDCSLLINILNFGFHYRTDWLYRTPNPSLLAR